MGMNGYDYNNDDDDDGNGHDSQAHGQGSMPNTGQCWVRLSMPTNKTVNTKLGHDGCAKCEDTTMTTFFYNLSNPDHSGMGVPECLVSAWEDG